MCMYKQLYKVLPIVILHLLHILSRFLFGCLVYSPRVCPTALVTLDDL